MIVIVRLIVVVRCCKIDGFFKGELVQACRASGFGLRVEELRLQHAMRT